MPQMMPLYWLFLYLMFTLILCTCVTKVYFSNSKTMNLSYQDSKILEKIFKWTW